MKNATHENGGGVDSKRVEPAALELSAAEVLEQVCTLLQVRISDAGEVTRANLVERINTTIDALSSTTHKLEQLTRSHAELSRTLAIVKAAVG